MTSKQNRGRDASDGRNK